LAQKYLKTEVEQSAISYYSLLSFVRDNHVHPSKKDKSRLKVIYTRYSDSPLLRHSVFPTTRYSDKLEFS